MGKNPGSDHEKSLAGKFGQSVGSSAGSGSGVETGCRPIGASAKIELASDHGQTRTEGG
jgi:hypothetical protein